VAIGARYNSGTGSYAGHVRVFKYDDDKWTQKPPSVYNTGPETTVYNTGPETTVYNTTSDIVYNTGPGTTVYNSYYDIDGEAAGDRSGESVSLSSDGTIMAIGASYNDGNGTDAGHVRVFKNVDTIWTQIGSDIDGDAEGDYSGVSVSLSSDGTIVAIGATTNDGTGTDAGHVRVFRNVDDDWIQIGSDIDGEVADDESGISVSLSSDGTIVAIGATKNDGTGSSAGHVRVFKNVSDIWTQIGSDIDGEASGDRSGVSVSLSSDGTIVAIGATRNDGSDKNAGHVRVFKNVDNVWTQIGSDIDGEAEDDESGISVRLSSDGTIVAIGTGTNAGQVRVFKNVDNVWTQIGSDIDGEASGDESGYSVSLSSDGTIMAIGATKNDGTDSNAGHVRVFKNVDNVWTQIGSDIDGEAASD
jgi:Flp pilus assembly pilin Flp